MNIIELIERNANELRDGECWTLNKVKHVSGYQYVGNRRAHRVAYEAHYAEPIPERLVVCHTCDNRECFNPAHLFLGTQAENMADCVRKGRQGARGPKPKIPRLADLPSKPQRIPEGTIRVAKELLADGISQRNVARLLGISNGSVANIAQGSLS